MENVREEMGQIVYGRSRKLALAGSQCIKCGEFNLEFRDEISRKEYGISALCQPCQDQIFFPDEDTSEWYQPKGCSSSE